MSLGCETVCEGGRDSIRHPSARFHTPNNSFAPESYCVCSPFRAASPRRTAAASPYKASALSPAAQSAAGDTRKMIAVEMLSAQSQAERLAQAMPILTECRNTVRENVRHAVIELDECFDNVNQAALFRKQQLQSAIHRRGYELETSINNQVARRTVTSFTVSQSGSICSLHTVSLSGAGLHCHCVA